jgi:beta-mannosidase
VVLAREAGLDLLRVHGHISRPELYEAADRHGMLLWQDLPLQWRYAGAGVRQQAVRQAGEAVDLLGHHPSIAVWCGHNEPMAVDDETTGAGFVARQMLPTWNKSVLDRSIHRALVRADGTRPVVAHSGVLPHPAWGTDSHLYYGWYLGDERQLPEVLARLPVLARFVSEFGAQAVPDDASWCQPERWPELDWERLARVHCLQKERFDCYVPPAAYPTFAAWRDATQAYQARVIRFHIETMRRLKYRPTGGFCQFAFGDGQPAVTWSVLDHERRPKAGWSALAAACAPVIVVADRPADTYRAGQEIRLAVHVVSDLRTPIEGAHCHARLRWAGGDRGWHFTGDVGADSCARVGLVRMAAPASDGPLDLDLDLTWPAGKAHNHYASRIVS